MKTMKMRKISDQSQLQALVAWLDENCVELSENQGVGELRYTCPNDDCSSHDKEPGHIAFSVNAKTGVYNCFHCQLKGKWLGHETQGGLLQNLGLDSPGNNLLKLSKARQKQLEKLGKRPEKEDQLRQDIKEKFEELPGWAHPDFPEQAKTYWQATRGLDSQSAIDLGVKWQEGSSVLNMPEALIMPSRDDEGALIYLSGSNLDGKKCHPTRYKRRPLRSPHQTNEIVLVEGAFDMAAVFQAGFTSWALLGTGGGIRGRDLKCLKDKEVILCLDGDQAGQEASTQLKKDLTGVAASIIEVKLPDKKDPNDILREESVQKLKELIASQKTGTKSPLASSKLPADLQIKGVSEGDCNYLNENGDGISSFIIKPLHRVWNAGKEDLIVDFITTDKQFKHYVMPRNCWTGIERFLKQLPSIDLQFHGSFRDVQSILGLVSQYDIPSKKGTPKLGFHQDQGVWVMPEQTLDKDGIVVDGELQYLPVGGRGELDKRVTYKKLEDSDFQDFMEKLLGNLFQLQDLEVVMPILGWFMATPLKPKLQQYFGGFPVLMVSGTRGAGKTSLMKLMWALFGFSNKNHNKLFSVTETSFMLDKLFSASTSIPIVFDEYKVYDLKNDARQRFLRHLRCTYDGESTFRGRQDLTSAEYSLTSPVAVIGEDSLTEGALQERIIPVNISANGISEEMRTAFHLVSDLPLTAFCQKYVPYMMDVNFEDEIQRAEKMVDETLSTQPVDSDRIKKNLTTVVFGIQQFFNFASSLDLLEVDHDLAVEEMVQSLRKRLCGEGQSARLALDVLIEHLATMAERRELEPNQDYAYLSSSEEIAIRTNNCLAAFRKYHNQTQLSDELLGTDAYRRQMKESMKKGGYVVDMNRNARYGNNGTKRSVVLSLEMLEQAKIDPKGFLLYKENEEVEGV